MRCLQQTSKAPPEYRPTPIAVVGTSMDSAKTQSAVYLVRGLIAAAELHRHLSQKLHRFVEMIEHEGAP